ncbi:MORN1 [Symbiodinium natans]|uniref:MORN1 protein n=1 Tax=Symbiodinium natans TaxID=878477 RepID=A0A812S9Q7_9DINO|nr:MORN1 [Symbiodinium natans]
MSHRPPPPQGFPGVKRRAPEGDLSLVLVPPPPTCLPGSKADRLLEDETKCRGFGCEGASGTRTSRSLVLAPPPPIGLPCAPRAPLSDSCFLAPPPPVGLPEVAGRLSTPGLPNAEPSHSVVVSNSCSASESGEDSDDDVPVENGERHRSDMEVLLAHRSSLLRTTSRQTRLSEDIPASAHELARETRSEDQHPFKPSKLSFFERVFRHGGSDFREAGGRQSMLHQLQQDMAGLDDAWFGRWSSLLSKEGLSCTKVATNGKPYARRLHVDCRNMIVEIHGGRSGTVGILLDDVVDVCKDLESSEFARYRQHNARHEHKEMACRALILHTPARSFSFLFANASQRDVFGQFLMYLLKKRRGTMSVDTVSAATTARDDVDELPASEASSYPPKEGRGKVAYPDSSWYEGDFSAHQRHGQGTLHLLDGSKHECQWQNDERHGPGREHWADGTVFRGHYVHGLRHGQGVMTWPEGSRYTGLFERGRANGDGELVRTDNSVYRGQFKEDCMSGDGCMQWVDGVEYKGQFEANRRHGFGKMVWTSGKWKSYEGSWKAGVQHGRGILTDQKDVAYVGHFLDGKIDHWEGNPPDSGF